MAALFHHHIVVHGGRPGLGHTRVLPLGCHRGWRWPKAARFARGIAPLYRHSTTAVAAKSLAIRIDAHPCLLRHPVWCRPHSIFPTGAGEHTGIQQSCEPTLWNVSAGQRHGELCCDWISPGYLSVHRAYPITQPFGQCTRAVSDFCGWIAARRDPVKDWSVSRCARRHATHSPPAE